ncbi:MAG: hypothetical protein OIN88_09565 [Candidatus Methanoperedens sp.]|nr:hypothetical protein [Candidatus Methanoperedens sp.]MCZ7359148.1 hypothetical protein [Candidatus Methanoperedens sp.]HLB72037.1 hypothetical protein [Candidatus Methanoperedens sp.]
MIRTQAPSSSQARPPPSAFHLCSVRRGFTSPQEEKPINASEFPGAAG